jgi:hypothetical protein
MTVEELEARVWERACNELSAELENSAVIEADFATWLCVFAALRAALRWRHESDIAWKLVSQFARGVGRALTKRGLITSDELAFLDKWEAAERAEVREQ